MRSFLKNKEANVKMIGMVVGIFVTLLISILVFYNIWGSIDVSDIDSDIGVSNQVDADNATTDISEQAATFYQIAPIIGIVVVAVVILSYVGKI